MRWVDAVIRLRWRSNVEKRQGWVRCSVKSGPASKWRDTKRSLEDRREPDSQTGDQLCKISREEIQQKHPQLAELPINMIVFNFFLLYYNLKSSNSGHEWLHGYKQD